MTFHRARIRFSLLCFLAASLSIFPALRAGSPSLASILAEAREAAEKNDEAQLRAKLLEAIYAYPKRADAFLLLGELTKSEGDRNPKPELAHQSYVLAFASYQRALKLEPTRPGLMDKFLEIEKLMRGQNMAGKQLSSIQAIGQ